MFVYDLVITPCIFSSFVRDAVGPLPDHSKGTGVGQGWVTAGEFREITRKISMGLRVLTK